MPVADAHLVFAPFAALSPFGPRARRGETACRPPSLAVAWARRQGKRVRSETERVGRGNALSGLAVMCHGYDYISFLVPFLNIPVRLDDLLQRIAPIYDRS